MWRMEILYLRYNQLANAFAVGLHSKYALVVACRDVEFDAGAAALCVISVCCPDGQHCVSQRSVLR